MSQQKFASNVVEKCLTFGGPEERQVLVNEMLGYTDENEPLQVCKKKNLCSLMSLGSLPLTPIKFAGDDEGSVRELRSAEGS